MDSRLLLFDKPADSSFPTLPRAQGARLQRERHTVAETAYAAAPASGAAASGPVGRGPMSRRLAILAWAGSEAFLRAALIDEEQHRLKQVAEDRPHQAAGEAAAQPPPTGSSTCWKQRLGDEQFWQLAEAVNVAGAADLRVNLLKAKREDVQAALKEKGLASSPTPSRPGACGSKASRRVVRSSTSSRAARSRSRMRAANCCPC
ncbi:hypothetical protein ACU4GR_04725 [Methylobacterium oryzae CBMB20]